MQRWRIIVLEDGREWVTDGNEGFDPAVVPELIGQCNALANILEVIREAASAADFRCPNGEPLLCEGDAIALDNARTTLKAVTT